MLFKKFEKAFNEEYTKISKDEQLDNSLVGDEEEGKKRKEE